MTANNTANRQLDRLERMLPSGTEQGSSGQVADFSRALDQKINNSANAELKSQVKQLSSQIMQTIQHSDTNTPTVDSKTAHMPKHAAVLSSISALPLNQQMQAMQHLIGRVMTNLQNSLQDKTATGATVVQNKTNLTMLDSLQQQLQVATVANNPTNMLGAVNQLPNITPAYVSDTDSISPYSSYQNYGNNIILNNNIFASGNGVPVGDSVPNLHTTIPLSQSFLDQCDLPTQIEYIMLWLADGPITNTMDYYSNQLIALGNNSQVVNGFSPVMSGVVSFFEQNSNLVANANVNVFQAIAYYQNPASESNANQATIAFANSLGPNGLANAFYAAITNSMNQWNAANPGNQVSATSLAQNSALQTEFMQYFFAPVNNAAYAINSQSGSSTPIAGANWWTSSSDLYNDGTLTFNSNNVTTEIGNNTQNSMGAIQLAINNIQIKANTINNGLQMQETYNSNLFNDVLNICNTVMNNANSTMNTVINNISS